MKKLVQGRTCFIIAYRLLTIQHADTIIVIKDEIVFEQGNHEELMKSGGLYSTLYNSQFN